MIVIKVKLYNFISLTDYGSVIFAVFSKLIIRFDRLNFMVSISFQTGDPRMDKRLFNDNAASK